MQLVVVTSVVHFQHEGQLYAYAPYARKMGLWAELFNELVFAAPCRRGMPPGDCIPLPCSNIRIVPQPEVGGKTLADKIAYLWWLPSMIWRLGSVLRKADAIHVRCPGNLGLLGALLAPLFSKRLVAKYAGQWVDFPGEPASVRFQRRLLSSLWWKGPVMVYGDWPGQPEHIVPSFASILTEADLVRARRASQQRSMMASQLEIVYVGRLSRQKKVHVVLKAIAKAKNSGADFRLTVIGEGPERDALAALARDLGIADVVHFTGGVAHERVLDQLERADILTLVSESEGWPKAIVEGMAFGLICIGSNRGLIPQILGDGRGYVVEVDDVDGLMQTLCYIDKNPAQSMEMSKAATQWASQFSTERLRDAIGELLQRHWGTVLRRPVEQESIETIPFVTKQ